MSSLCCTPQKKKASAGKDASVKLEELNVIEETADLEYDPTATGGEGNMGTQQPVSHQGSMPLLAVKQIARNPEESAVGAAIVAKSALALDAERGFTTNAMLAEEHLKLVIKYLDVLSNGSEGAQEHIEALQSEDDSDADEDFSNTVMAIALQSDRTAVQQSVAFAQTSYGHAKLAAVATAAELSKAAAIFKEIVDYFNTRPISGDATASCGALASAVQSCQPLVVDLTAAVQATTQHFESTAASAKTATEQLDAEQLNGAFDTLGEGKTHSSNTKETAQAAFDTIAKMRTAFKDMRGHTYQLLTAIDPHRFQEVRTQDTLCTAVAAGAIARIALAEQVTQILKADVEAATKGSDAIAQSLRSLSSLQKGETQSSEWFAKAHATSAESAEQLQGSIKTSQEDVAGATSSLGGVAKQTAYLTELLEQVRRALHHEGHLPDIPAEFVSDGPYEKACTKIVDQATTGDLFIKASQRQVNDTFSIMNEKPLTFLGGDDEARIALGRTLGTQQVSMAMSLDRAGVTVCILRECAEWLSSAAIHLRQIHETVSDLLYQSVQSFLDRSIVAPTSPQVLSLSPQTEASDPLPSQEPPSPTTTATTVTKEHEDLPAKSVESGASSGPYTSDLAAAAVAEQQPADQLYSRHVILTRDPVGGLGFSFGTLANRPGVIVVCVAQGRPAERSGAVFQGDNILSINGKPTEGLSHEAIMATLQSSDTVDLELLSRSKAVEGDHFESTTDDSEPAALPTSAATTQLTYPGFTNVRTVKLVRPESGPDGGKMGFSVLASKHTYQCVTNISSGSPADVAGLKEGDTILAVNNQSVLQSSHHDLVGLLAGKSFDLTVGNPEALDAAAAQSVKSVQESSAIAEAALVADKRETLVVDVTRLDGRLGMTILTDQNKRAKIVTSVLTGSAAEKAGIRKGDIVRKVDDVDISDLAHKNALATLNKEAPMKLTIERGFNVESAEVALSQDSAPTSGVATDSATGSAPPAAAGPSSSTVSAGAKAPIRAPVPAGSTYHTVLTRSNEKGLGLRIRTTDVQQGSLVIGLHEGSPAEACNQIKAGDYLVAVNGESILTKTHSEVVALLGAKPEASLELLRPHQAEASSTLATAAASVAVPVEPSSPAAQPVSPVPIRAPVPPGGKYRIVLKNVGAGLGLRIRTTDVQQGSLVIGLHEGSPAQASNGIEPGDYLIGVNGENILLESHQQIVALLAAKPEVALEFIRPHKPNVPASATASTASNPATTTTRSVAFAPTVVPSAPAVTPSAEPFTYDPTAVKHVKLVRTPDAGFGMRLRTIEHRPGTRVVNIFPGGPADKSGQVAVADVIVNINGEDAVHMPHNKVIERMKANEVDLDLVPQDPSTLDPGQPAASTGASIEVPAPAVGTNFHGTTPVLLVGSRRHHTVRVQDLQTAALSQTSSSFYPSAATAIGSIQPGESIVSINGVGTWGRDAAGLSALANGKETVDAETCWELGPVHLVTLVQNTTGFGLKLSSNDIDGISVKTSVPGGSASQCPTLKPGSWVAMINGQPLHRDRTAVSDAIRKSRELTVVVAPPTTASHICKEAIKHDSISYIALRPVGAQQASIDDWVPNSRSETDSVPSGPQVALDATSVQKEVAAFEHVEGASEFSVTHSSKSRSGPEPKKEQISHSVAVGSSSETPVVETSVTDDAVSSSAVVLRGQGTADDDVVGAEKRNTQFLDDQSQELISQLQIETVRLRSQVLEERLKAEQALADERSKTIAAETALLLERQHVTELEEAMNAEIKRTASQEASLILERAKDPERRQSGALQHAELTRRASNAEEALAKAKGLIASSTQAANTAAETAAQAEERAAAAEKAAAQAQERATASELAAAEAAQKAAEAAAKLAETEALAAEAEAKAAAAAAELQVERQKVDTFENALAQERVKTAALQDDSAKSANAEHELAAALQANLKSEQTKAAALEEKTAALEAALTEERRKAEAAEQALAAAKAATLQAAESFAEEEAEHQKATAMLVEQIKSLENQLDAERAKNAASHEEKEHKAVTERQKSEVSLMAAGAALTEAETALKKERQRAAAAETALSEERARATAAEAILQTEKDKAVVLQTSLETERDAAKAQAAEEAEARAAAEDLLQQLQAELAAKTQGAFETEQTLTDELASVKEELAVLRAAQESRSSLSAPPAGPSVSPKPARRSVPSTRQEPEVDLDEEVTKISKQLGIPKSKIQKIANEKYKFFDDPKLVNVRIFGKNVMVRVGGGWQRLPEYLQMHQGAKEFTTKAM
eukprot:m.30835 g.30835  ORF g.30835 m.30835 type:complete len:2261 (+) comp4817_c0_seq1:44-6826(+)